MVTTKTTHTDTTLTHSHTHTHTHTHLTNIFTRIGHDIIFKITINK